MKEYEQNIISNTFHLLPRYCVTGSLPTTRTTTPTTPDDTETPPDPPTPPPSRGLVKNLPLEGGSVLITKGTVDLLLTAFRLIHFFRRISSLAYGNKSDCDVNGDLNRHEDLVQFRNLTAEIIFEVKHKNIMLLCSL